MDVNSVKPAYSITFLDGGMEHPRDGESTFGTSQYVSLIPEPI